MATSEDVRKAKSAIKDGAGYKYFFDRLTSAAWITPLIEEGMFADAPPAIRSGGYVSFPEWPASRYLIRMATKAPADVVTAIKGFPETDNVRVGADIVAIALVLPIDLSVKLLDVVQKWTAHPHVFIMARAVGELMERYARAGQTDAALLLAKDIFDINVTQDAAIGPRVHGRIPDWDYWQIMKTRVPSLIASDARRSFTILCEFLLEAVEASIDRASVPRPEDFSFIWRPSLEEEDESAADDVKDALVNGVRTAALGMAAQGLLRESIRILEDHQTDVFRRIAMFTLGQVDDAPVEIVREYILNKELFQRSHVANEYAQLLARHFAKLSDKDRELLLAWIEDETSDENIAQQLRESSGEEPRKDEVLDYKGHSLLNRLSVIADSLPPVWKGRYDQLIATIGAPAIDHRPFRMGTFVGPISPKSLDEIKAMSIPQLVAYLRDWVPPGGFAEPSRDGLRGTVAEAIKADAITYSRSAEAFIGLDPSYISSLFNALADALRSGQELDWEPVLKVVLWVVAQTRDVSDGKNHDNRRLDVGWHSTRNAAASVLRAGLIAKDSPIPISHRESVWRALEELTQDPDPTVEHEQQYGGSNMDSFTMSINTTRGEAFHAVVAYCLWVRQAVELDKKGMSLVPEAKAVLEKHLNTELEPTLTIRAVYGNHFPRLAYFDEQWAREWVNVIFPVDEQHKPFFEAAWAAYVSFNPAYDSVFALLMNQYETAIGRMETRKKAVSQMTSSDEHLAYHVIGLYLRSIIPLGGSGLVSQFFGKASVKLRGHALGVVGRWFEEKAPPTDATERAKSLWEERVSSAHTEVSTEKKHELSAFGSWFVSGAFEDAWAISKLVEVLKLAGAVESAHRVVERLPSFMKEHPAQAIECLLLMIRGDEEGWGVMFWKDHVRRVLALVGTEDPALKVGVRDVVNELVRRGHYEFRDLYPR